MDENTRTIALTTLNKLRNQRERITNPAEIASGGDAALLWKKMLDTVKELLNGGDTVPDSGAGSVTVSADTLRYLMTVIREMNSDDAAQRNCAYAEIPGLLDDLEQLAALQRRERAGLTSFFARSQ